MRRHALVIGLLAGLAVAPAVDAVHGSSGGTATLASADGGDRRAAPGPGSGVHHGRLGAAGAVADAASDRLPTFTHRSAELADVDRRPVRLRIGALRVDAPVDDFGRAADGQLDVPGDARTVAWYREGPTPGGAGSAVLAAHVDYDGSPGVFRYLDRLTAGDTVRVDFDDGSTAEFAVTVGQRYDKQRLPIRELFTRDGDAVLTLITCGGRFDPTTRSYDANVVVTAELVDAG